jgi:hypothetical protein
MPKIAELYEAFEEIRQARAGLDRCENIWFPSLGDQNRCEGYRQWVAEAEERAGAVFAELVQEELKKGAADGRPRTV